MANLTRYKQKIFANNSNQVGVFGTGTDKVASKNVETLQSADYEDGWSSAIVTSKNYPVWQERDGVDYGFSYQLAYLLQKGIPEWLSTETYYTNDFCKSGNKIYYSLQDNNINQNPTTATTYWAEGTGANIDLSNLSATGHGVIDGQWVKSYLILATNVTQSFSDGAVDYSLSSYLPNDNYKYEVLFSGFGEGSTTNSGLYLYLATDTIGDASEIIAGSNYNGAQIVRTKGTAYGAGCVVLPVGSARKVTAFCSNTYNGKYYLIALGYRRIGTNQ